MSGTTDTRTNDERQRDRILESLAPLKARARAEGLWFFSLYRPLAFTPQELATANEQGQFLWDATQWVLADPIQRRKQLEASARIAQEALAKFDEKIRHEFRDHFIPGGPPFIPIPRRKEPGK